MGIGVCEDWRGQDGLGAAGDGPHRVVVAVEASKAYTGGAEKADEFADLVDRDDGIFGRFGGAEGEHRISGAAIEEEECAAVPLGIEWVGGRDIDIPPFAGVGIDFRGRGGGGSVAKAIEAGAGGGGSVEDWGEVGIVPDV